MPLLLICPYHINFSAEVESLLVLGCRVQVLTDTGGGEAWHEFHNRDGFAFVSLDELFTTWAEYLGPTGIVREVR